MFLQCLPLPPETREGVCVYVCGGWHSSHSPTKYHRLINSKRAPTPFHSPLMSLENDFTSAQKKEGDGHQLQDKNTTLFLILEE